MDAIIVPLGRDPDTISADRWSHVDVADGDLLAGRREIVGSSLWVQIDTPAGDFWVSDQFLAPVS